MNFLLVIHVEDEQGSQTLDEHDFRVFSICYNLNRSKVVDFEGFEGAGSDGEIRSAGAELSTFCQRIYINCLGLPSNYIQKLI